MIIRGTGINTFAAMNNMLQRKTNASPVSGTPFAKRFDTLVLSDLFKKYAKTKESSTDVSEIKKMLTETENKDQINTVTEGIAGYTYMEKSLLRESALTKADSFLFGRCKDEKAYYQSLLNEADGVATSASVPPAQDYFEYKCPDGGEIDREEVEKALANVQSRIDSFINNTQEKYGLENKTDIETFNKSAKAVSDAFGIDSSELVLNEDGYNKLFGDLTDITEENYIQKCEEKIKNISSYYHSMTKQMSGSLERIRSENGGEKRAAAIEKAINELSFGNSYNDILSLIDEIMQAEEQTENF